MTIYSNPTFVDTYESCSLRVYCSGTNIVIPYVNLALLPENPINKTIVSIDYCYYVFKRVSSLVIGGIDHRLQMHFITNRNINVKVEHVIFGRYPTTKYVEVAIEYDTSDLYIPKEAQIVPEGNFWHPLDSPIYGANMNRPLVDAFFECANFPVEIKQNLTSELYFFELS